MHSRKAFTLIELLVVIAIIAILAVVVVLTLNPAALLQQSRDSNRVSDMSTLNSAINLYNTDQSGASGYSLGSSSVVYVSIPDPNASTTAGSNCASLNLLTLPTGYIYHCAASSTYRNVNGTGWIPVNLSNISAGSPLSNLPVDPTNTSSSRLYYTYTTNGSQFELTAPMESQKYQLGGSNDVISGDGGTLASVYEKGSKLGLEPLDYGDPSLVGYWPLNEGSGTIAYDLSGNGNNGTWNGTPTGTSGYYSPGMSGGWAGAFDGSTDSVYSSYSPGSKTVTITAWINSSTSTSINFIAGFNPVAEIALYNGDLALWTWGSPGEISTGINIADGKWHFVACSYQSGGTNGANCYVDGVLEVTATMSSPNSFTGTEIGGPGPDFFTGLIQNVHIYNRVLSAAQITAMYNGGK